MKQLKPTLSHTPVICWPCCAHTIFLVLSFTDPPKLAVRSWATLVRMQLNASLLISGKVLSVASQTLNLDLLLLCRDLLKKVIEKHLAQVLGFTVVNNKPFITRKLRLKFKVRMQLYFNWKITDFVLSLAKVSWNYYFCSFLWFGVAFAFQTSGSL